MQVLQRRCLRASQNLSKGNIVTNDMIEILRPAPKNSILPYEIDNIIGKKLTKDVIQGDTFKWSDIDA